MSGEIRDSAHWRRVEEIFGAALEQEAGRREEFLASACGADAALRAEVESLLAHERDSGGEIGRVVSTAAASYTHEPKTNPDLGLKIGPYQIVREVARGGMGIVYVAVRRDAEYAQVVAIKIIRSGLRSDRFVRRFRDERQFLASLQHASIATIIDGGSTPDGRPYIVMEYIEGEPITAYCERHELDLSQRLELMRTVCQAIGYAHRRRVLHRDLKPENILVTREGTVKLVDFGVAKLLEPDMVVAGPTTSSFRFLTPAYASPEQFAGSRLTAAADVYALGVVMYELLSGQHPWEELRPTPYKMAVAASKGSPPPPSEAKATSPLRRKQLRGDLDRIVLKALARDHEARYQSGEELAEEIERYRRGFPVSAASGSILYRLAKLIGRHPGMALMTAVSVVLLSLVGALGWQVNQIRRELSITALPDQAAARLWTARQSAAGGDYDAAAAAFSDAISILDRARAAGVEASRLQPLLASAHSGAAVVALRRDRLAEATGFARAGLEAARSAGRDELMAFALFAEGDVLSRRGDVRGAMDSFRQACGLDVSQARLAAAAPLPGSTERWLAACQPSSQ